ncbi:MAG: hypothetical protein WDO24_22750 [Pseudomonadota bacterium]
MTQSTPPTVAETLAAAIAAVTPTALPGALRAMADNMVLDIIGLCCGAPHRLYPGRDRRRRRRRRLHRDRP